RELVLLEPGDAREQAIVALAVVMEHQADDHRADRAADERVDEVIAPFAEIDRRRREAGRDDDAEEVADPAAGGVDDRAEDRRDLALLEGPAQARLEAAAHENHRGE